MISRIRTVAVLMLLAGLALGVLSARTVRALGTTDVLTTAAPPPTTGGSARIDQLVSIYQEEFKLDDTRTYEVRQALETYDRKVARLLWDCRQEKADEFRALFDEASAEIREILDLER